jgi:hypothetical protein
MSNLKILRAMRLNKNYAELYTAYFKIFLTILRHFERKKFLVQAN